MAKTDSLTHARLRAVLAYDPMTGLFTWLVATNSRITVGRVAGTLTDDGYWKIGLDGRDYLAHVLAWFHVHGVWPDDDIDHRDTIKHHNWLSNLRPATRAENLQNRRGANSNNKTGVLGVFWNKQRRKFEAKVVVKKKAVFRDFFDTIEDAAAAHRAAKALHHPFHDVAS